MQFILLFGWFSPFYFCICIHLGEGTFLTIVRRLGLAFRTIFNQNWISVNDNNHHVKGPVLDMILSTMPTPPQLSLRWSGNKKRLPLRFSTISTVLHSWYVYLVSDRSLSHIIFCLLLLLIPRSKKVTAGTKFSIRDKSNFERESSFFRSFCLFFFRIPNNCVWKGQNHKLSHLLSSHTQEIGAHTQRPCRPHVLLSSDVPRDRFPPRRRSLFL